MLANFENIEKAKKKLRATKPSITTPDNVPRGTLSEEGRNDTDVEPTEPEKPKQDSLTSAALEKVSESLGREIRILPEEIQLDLYKVAIATPSLRHEDIAPLAAKWPTILMRNNQNMIDAILKEPEEARLALFDVAEKMMLTLEDIPALTASIIVPPTDPDRGKALMEQEAEILFKLEQAKKNAVIKHLSEGGVPLPPELITEVLERYGKLSEEVAPDRLSELKTAKLLTQLITAAWRKLKDKGLLEELYQEVLP